jgi:hypothetical protein
LLRPLQRHWICRDLEFAETFAEKEDPMQSRYKFIVFFFLQPCGCLSPCPCTKAATLDGSKLNHLHRRDWSHCIFRIAFITIVYSKMGPYAKGGKMAWDEPLRPGAERYCEFENARWSARDLVHPDTLRTIPWAYAILIEDVLTIVFVFFAIQKHCYWSS